MSRKGPLGYPFVRFLLVGGLNTLVGLGVMYGLLNGFGFSYWAATFTGNSIGAVVSFVLNRRFTFNSKAAHPRTYVLFVLVILCSYLLSYFIGLHIAIRLAAMLPIATGSLVKNTAVVISTTLYTLTNYFGQKHVVFREKENPHEAKA